jgi:hypothetical protein
MKSITNLINEASKEHLTYDLKNDIYNVLSDLAFNYDKHNKDFNKDKVEEAIEWFLSEFYEQNPNFA